MRVAVVAFSLLCAALAGCSDPGTAVVPDSEAESFDDFEVEATATTGILLGVVVDEAIRPVQDVQISLNRQDGTPSEQVTDAEGRFAYGDLPPGDYLIQASHFKYAPVQMTATVVAGDEDPAVNKIQLTRLFAQEPFSELISYDGFLACAHTVGVSTTCVNDYTRVVGERCDPVTGTVCTSQCAGGCFRDQDLARQGGNVREYVSVIGPGWQSIVFEETWEPTSDAGQQLGFTVSYYSRPDAGHWFGQVDGPNPLRLQLDVGVEHESAAYLDGQPTMVDANGTEELFVFYGAGGFGSVVLNQQFRAFQTAFYYAVPPEGWSFVNGDPRPF